MIRAPTSLPTVLSQSPVIPDLVPAIHVFFAPARKFRFGTTRFAFVITALVAAIQAFACDLS
ncbi:hypothetical protein [Microvirga terricola]|uniref:Uncharacterized protein n=1 Tax=Microvirga terricola TaxID=2719797 RepID=A0ABX0VCB9_9HYPH|nr:hypothetical protein [Microvirga terricola]NIX77338.1 hypothetical protein [Microvirga terricola]